MARTPTGVRATTISGIRADTRRRVPITGLVLGPGATLIAGFMLSRRSGETPLDGHGSHKVSLAGLPVKAVAARLRPAAHRRFCYWTG